MNPKSYRLRESKVEGAVVKHAESTGWLSFKWKSANSRGVPDRLFFKDSTLLIVEFKSPGEKPSAQQKLIHGALRFAGFEVYIIDNIKTGRDLLDA
tara:strand:- start:288 stop:575 length:288 start_codon:yes stop_codon:yes gene_type:complete